VKADATTTVRLFCAGRGLPAPAAEYHFARPRRFRFDLCWMEQRVAMEIQGGIWNRGHHVRGKGYEDDCEKAMLAVSLGWRLLPATPGQIRSGLALSYLEKILRGAA